MRNGPKQDSYYLINISCISATLVPEGPVKYRESISLRKLYELLSIRWLVISNFDSVIALTEIVSIMPPAASVGPSIPSVPTDKRSHSL